jgi:glycine cleavage system H lipoate-binding protein
MKKQLNNYFWILEGEGDRNLVPLGMTKELIDRLGVIWVMTPRAPRALMQGHTFMNVESSRCLGPLKAPIDAKVEMWNDEALDNPEQLTDSTPICFLRGPIEL